MNVANNTLRIWKEYVPDSWNIVPLKYAITYNNEKLSDQTDGKYEFDYVDIGSVTYGNGIELYQHMKFEESPSRARRIVHTKDIIISTVRTYLKAIAQIEEHNNPIIVSTGFMTMRARDNIVLPDFLGYVAQSDGFVSEIECQSYGTSYPSITAGEIASLSIPLPPLSEQQAIVHYLDTKCAAIDEVIEKHKKIIEKLEEEERSIVFKTVTCGLDKDIDFKHSGIRWTPYIPKHWEARRLKYSVVVTNGSNPHTEGNIPVYGSGAKSFKTCGESKDPPTVLVGRKGATLHIPHYIDHPYWNVDTAFDTKPINDTHMKWFYYVARCLDYKYYITQTTLPSMTQTDYGNMIIPTPPIHEQSEIAEYLDTITIKLNNIKDSHKIIITKLEEYKKSIIYNAVTGKIDCREAIK